MLTHEEVQAALSARFDGEEPGISPDVLEAHVASCPQCAKFEQELRLLSTKLQPVRERMPEAELSTTILAGVEPEWRKVASTRQTHLMAARTALGLLACAFVVWAVALVDVAGAFASIAEEGVQLNVDSNAATSQFLIEHAAWRLGLAAGLGFAAWRPRQAVGLLPMLSTVLFFLVGFTMRDVIVGELTAQQVYTLLSFGTAVMALAWTWLADKGFSLRQFWRGLGAQPA
ncbi:MAG: zf-HC2 domain-containing protein [Corynebacterium sp.]|nr:zf-HC2 domain-containing protein [Corynebacterium sp.]